MGTITLATFNEFSKAEPLKHRLEQAHIPAEIHNESIMEFLWFVPRPLAFIRLKVHVRDYENALRLVREWDAAENILRDAIRCPECKSPRIEYPQMTRKFFLPNLIGLLAGMGMIQREFYCQDCQFTWPRGGPKPSRRKHMAPYYFLEGIPQQTPTTSTTKA